MGPEKMKIMHPCTYPYARMEYVNAEMDENGHIYHFECPVCGIELAIHAQFKIVEATNGE